MAGKVRYLIQRDGRYHARVVVPERLRPIIKKSELSAALGADRRTALRRLPGVVADFQEQVAKAEQRLTATSPASSPSLASFDPAKAALDLYRNSLEFDSELRDATPLYARFGAPDESYVEDLKSVIAGRLEDHELPIMFLTRIRRYVPARLALDRQAWRRATRILAQAELATIEVSSLRSEGEPDPALPSFLAAALPLATPTASVDTIESVFAGYRSELHKAGKARDAESRWAPIIANLLSSLGHNVAARITRRDAVRWKDQLLETLSPKTVRDTYLATAKAAFAWGVDNLDLTENPFTGVKVRLTKKVQSREKGFQLSEAEAILKASSGYPGSAKESQFMTAAKRWIPLLTAYTGARVGEIAQLRVEDVKCAEGINFIRITPAAGTVKSGLYRDVPLHDHILDQGFLEFVRDRGSGPLFYRNGARASGSAPAEVVSGRLSKWIRSLGVIGESVQPSHGWRHRFKAIGPDHKIGDRVLDAIQGHAPRTAGDRYGDVSLRAKHSAINSLPRYRLD
ncbi:integrase [Bradyrhizobium sp. Arg68]|uniref:DUF6538 domain-containing protein n=1 Tax=Bradyrhizobium ivorense TaxID=2511166 RepID=UPI001E603DFE|nr:DUF6538 domain-containing protein [Bradyrhizobium ivorense]MCC8941038.1 integrase [Bradyrhizobium ivorense]